MRFSDGSLDAHISHLYNLRAGVFDDKNLFVMPVVAQLAEVARGAEPSTAYTEHLEKVRQTFAAELLASAEFHDMLRRWPTLDIYTEQTPYLQKCINRLAELQSTCGVKSYPGRFGYYNDPKGTDSYVNFIINDDPAADYIGINLHKPDRTQDLLKAIRSVAHEQTHLFNGSLNRAFYTRAIKPEHPLHEEARYFREVYRVSASFPASYGEYAARDANPYLAQLDERAAYGFADTLHDELSAAVTFHGPPRPVGLMASGANMH